MLSVQVVPVCLLLHWGAGWSGGGGVLACCTGRGPGCRKFPGPCCPMIFSRSVLINDRQLIKLYSHNNVLLMNVISSPLRRSSCDVVLYLMSDWSLRGSAASPPFRTTLSRSLFTSTAWWNTHALNRTFATPIKNIVVKKWNWFQITDMSSEIAHDNRTNTSFLLSFRRSSWGWHVTHPSLLTLEHEDLRDAFVAFLHSYGQHGVVGAAVQHRFGLQDAAQRHRVQRWLQNQTNVTTTETHPTHQLLKYSYTVVILKELSRLGLRVLCF